MSKSNGLVLVASNGRLQQNDQAQVEDEQELDELIEVEVRGTPDFKFFSAQSEPDLAEQIRIWRDAEVLNDPTIGGFMVMSPTMDADGIWRVAVNFLVFDEEEADPW